MVKITAQADGKTKIGTGFVVKLDSEIVYIVTAAHVIAGDSQPKMQFFTRPDVPARAQVKHAEGGDEETGLALLTVRGEEHVPTGLTALPLAATVRVLGGEDIMVIGHPRGAGDWAVIKGSIASRQGRYLAVDANIDEGNSGGPIIQNGEVVGLIGGVTRYGRGVTSGSVIEYLKGHGISIHESVAAGLWKGSSIGRTVDFGGGKYCRYRTTLSDVSIEVAIDSGKRITTGTIYATATEQGLNNCPHPPIPSNRHHYRLSSSSNRLDEGEVTLIFNGGDGNAPGARATFKGTYVAAKLSGIITILRIDAEAPLDWRIDIPITLEPTTVSDTGLQPATAVVTPLPPESSLKQGISKDGAPMALMPAGEFMMGSPDREGTKNEYPQHRVYLDALYMDKFELTVSRYADFLRATGRQSPEGWQRVSRGKHDKFPVVGVDWEDADAYCRWAGKRLPTEAEWEKAARGTEGRMYPWGNEPPTTSLAKFASVQSSGRFSGELAPVGSYAAGKSPYGIYDLAGNVWEWTADWYDDHYYDKSPARNPKGPSSGEFRVLRGGSAFVRPGTVHSAFRRGSSPTNRTDDIGFRCAQDAPK